MEAQHAGAERDCLPEPTGEGTPKQGSLGPTEVLAANGQPPTFTVVIAFVSAIALLVLVISFALNSAQNDQIGSLERTLNDLRLCHDSIRGQLTQADLSFNVVHSEERTPHPALVDRDAQLTGRHVDISWTDQSQAQFSQPIYAISLTRLPDPPNTTGAERAAPSFQAVDQSSRNGPGDVRLPDCTVDLGNQTAPSAGFQCESLFIASDSNHRTSRIPIQIDKKLLPGHYVWRVAAVSNGYKTQHNGDPEVGMLSHWSNYGSFTLSSSLRDRIVDTGQVLVGVDLEQNSRFARNEGGMVVGDDVTLIRMLVEGCTRLGANRSIRYESAVCKSYYNDLEKCSVELQSKYFIRDPKLNTCIQDRQSKEDNRSDTSNPKRYKERLRVKFVPIAKWGDWRESLKRKEIDLFIGGLTAASARETGGISFIGAGYLPYRSHLYVDSSDARYQHLRINEWTKVPRRVGVIESSSNEILLDYIIEQVCEKSWWPGSTVAPTRDTRCPITKALYRDYPELDRAMDSGEIDGLLIDDTFVSGDEWLKLDNIDQIAGRAWRRYQLNFLGYSGLEHLSFAAAVDATQANTNGLPAALTDGFNDPQFHALLSIVFADQHLR